MFNTFTAILNLRPNAKFSITDEVIEWLDTEQTQPTEAEIQAEITRLQTEYDNNQYARERKARYDSLNQFEMQYDDAVNGTTTWQDAINAIKQEIPKGGN